MKRSFFILALGALMLTACDTVDEYTSFAGVTCEWSKGDGVEDKVQRAYVEKYTGAKCVMCPKGDEVLAEAHKTYGDQLIAVAIDGPGTLGEPYKDEPNTHTTVGDQWSLDFSISTLPTAVINRSKNNGQWELITNMDNIPAAIKEVVTTSPKIAVDFDAKMSGKNAIMEVNLEFVEEVKSPLTLTILIIEDSIISKQKTPTGIDKNYAHNHVLRAVITDLWGTDIEAQGTKGETIKGTCNYMMSPLWKIENCHIVAFVSDKNSREVLNVASCKL